jgi:hypothetical protein
VLLYINKFRADITVEVGPLVSGYSSEVHGIISVSARHYKNNIININCNNKNYNNNINNSDNSNSDILWKQSLLFKALDTGVKCSAMNKK